MIKEEYILTRSDGVEVYRHYSDKERYIIQVETGIKYEIAEDVHPCKYTYIESNEYLPSYIEKCNKEINEQYSDDIIEQYTTTPQALNSVHIHVEPTVTPATLEAEFEEIDSNEVN